MISRSKPLTPSLSRCVRTGHKGDTCSETWVTHRGQALPIEFSSDDRFGCYCWACGACGHRVQGLATGFGRYRDVHKSTGLAQIDRADLLGAEVNRQDTVLARRAQRHRVVAERFANSDPAVHEADVAGLTDSADDVPRSVFDRRQLLGK